MSGELTYSGTPSQTGLTLTAKVLDTGGVQIGATVVLTEAGGTSYYAGDMPTASAGAYTVRIFNGASMVAQGDFFWSGDFEVTLYRIWQRLANRFETDPTDGKARLYDDDDTTVLLEALVFEAASGPVAYSSTSKGIERINRLVAP